MPNEQKTKTIPGPEAKTQPPRFTVEQLTHSARFCRHRDALCAVLRDSETYTIDEAQKALDGFLKGQVKG